MGTIHNESNHASHPPSVVSEDDELRGTGVQVSPHVSPQYSEREAQSRAGSSEFREEFVRVHLPYPSELQDPEVDPSDSASRLESHHRAPLDGSRSSSSRRDVPRPRTGPREAGLHRPREPPGETESVADSTEDFLRQPYPSAMPRPQSYYADNGYTHSSSSGSYVYPHPQMPAPAGQIVHYAPPQMPVQYAPQYHQMNSPQPMYAPSHSGYPISHHPGSHVSSPYGPSPYPPPSMMGYGGPPPGYFGPQYPQPYPHPATMDAWRVYSPPPNQNVPAAPSAAPSNDPDKPKLDPDDIAKRIEALMLAQSEKESEARMRREEARAAAEKAAFDEAAAKADRAAAEQRIRDEATASALKAAADAAQADAERAAREQKIREEAAAAALKAAAQEAEAKAEAAKRDAKIAEEAASAARTEAEKKAAEEAAKNKEESEKKQKEAEQKLEEAEKAAAQAKAEAEEATKKAEAAAPPPEKKAPIRFHDAVGRKFNFPFELCTRWRGMESLINQAFQHVEVIGEHVQHGHYDLVGPTGEIILPALWEAIIEPDWVITMHMWPMPEKKEEDPMIPPPMDDLGGMGGMLDMEAILNGGKKPKEKPRGAPKRSKSRPGAFSSWMLGASSGKAKPTLKGDKKPDVAAGSQHGDTDQGACTVM